MLKERTETAQEDRWNVEALYPDFKTWDKDFATINQKDKWPEIASFKDRLCEGEKAISEALKAVFKISRQLEKLYTYAHLRHDEDIADTVGKTAFAKITALYHEFVRDTAWIEPELLSIPEATMQKYLKTDELKNYDFYIEKIIRLRKHTLNPSEEKLIALAGQTMMTPCKTFSAMNDADFKFGKVLDAKGVEHELSHASYAIYTREQDRILRKNAFDRLHQHYKSYENTLCELINGQVQCHLFNARARNYSSCLEAALYPKNIDTSVYRTLIEATTEKIGALHKYISLRKKALGLDELHYYDLYVPLTKDLDIKMSYKEAEEVVVESVSHLGPEYQKYLRRGLLEERWVDRYENKNKRSGAYSSGCYDSMPYILMNYKDLLRDVFTLAHEAGHSMHSLLSRQNQPYWYADYHIFVAEVASTFNEDLLMRLLLSRAKSKEEKIFLINQKIEDIRGTLFRQTLFAEFELMIHEMAEQHIPLTPALLKQEFRKLNTKYFGPDLIVDEEADIEWARIPHFYYNFYVYQYATGISAALTLCDGVVNGGQKERDAYLNFLKSGGKNYPIELLQLAGVDMRSTEPVPAAIDKFDSLVNELESLLTL